MCSIDLLYIYVLRWTIPDIFVDINQGCPQVIAHSDCAIYSNKFFVDEFIYGIRKSHTCMVHRKVQPRTARNPKEQTGQDQSKIEQKCSPTCFHTQKKICGKDKKKYSNRREKWQIFFLNKEMTAGTMIFLCLTCGLCACALMCTLQLCWEGHTWHWWQDIRFWKMVACNW